MIGLNDGYYNFSSVDDGNAHDILKELDYIFSEKESFMLSDGNMESTPTISQKKTVVHSPNFRIFNNLLTK